MKDKKYFIIQKIYGSAMIILSVISTLVTKDGTISLLLIPMGIYTIFTKEKVIDL